MAAIKVFLVLVLMWNNMFKIWCDCCYNKEKNKDTNNDMKTKDINNDMKINDIKKNTNPSKISDIKTKIINNFKNNINNRNIETYADAIKQYYSKVEKDEKIYGLDRNTFKQYYVDGIFLFELGSKEVKIEMEEQDLDNKGIGISEDNLILPEIITNKVIIVTYPRLLVSRTADNKEKTYMTFSIKYRINIEGCQKFKTTIDRVKDLKFKKKKDSLSGKNVYETKKDCTEDFIKKIVKDLNGKNITVEILGIKCNDIKRNDSELEMIEGTKILVNETIGSIFKIIGEQDELKQQLFKIFMRELFKIYLKIDVNYNFSSYTISGDVQTTKEIKIDDLKKNMIADIPHLQLIDS